MDQGAESFDLRVKRLFGSKLFEAVPESSFPASFPSPSWSVADGEVDCRAWNRDRGSECERENDPCSSAFYDKDGCLLKNRKGRRDKQREFEGDLDAFDDGDEEQGMEKGAEEEDEGDEEREEREIRSSVGLDPTLDNEDEEDEYDKAAVGKENSDERVYMRNVKDHSPFLSYNAIVPDLLDEACNEPNHFCKDPRADHFAAIARLREDKTFAEGCLPASLHTNDESSRKSPFNMSQNDVTVKPILKRREAQVDTKPKKRVRFDPGCKEDHDESFEEPQDLPMVPQSMETNETNGLSEVQTSMLEESPGVPDYLRNPSQYTRYTFGSLEEGDEETNRRAFEDYRKLVTGSKLEAELLMELPKSVAFTPRKKVSVVVPMDDSPLSAKQIGQLSGSSMGVAAGEVNESDACEMDEDETEFSSVHMNTSIRRGRQYRSKSMSDDSS